MEVGPTMHYVMGGVRVDADSAGATVPGLFAAGEVAAGLHGANRLGGNSLSDLVVFGRRAGLAAAQFAQAQARSPHIPESEIAAEIADVLAPFERAAGESPYELHRTLQACMADHVGIFRTQDDLERGLELLGELQRRVKNVRVEGGRTYNPGWHLARDLRNMLTVSEAVTRSAILRTESRGAHSRLDHPATSDALAKVNFCATRAGDAMQVSPTPLPEMPAEMRALFEAAKEKVG
jgi:succinate dehydrogenase / fumarate reductase flavoprotein subunit